MGGLFSKKKSNKTEKPAKKADPAPAKSRVNEADKSILEIKTRVKKLKMYSDKLALDVKGQNEKIQGFLKDKNKNRAMMALKHRKFMEKQLDKSFAAQGVLEQTLRNIESAQMDVNIFDAMKQGDRVIEELHKQVTLEQFEELYERHQDQQARKDMEAEMFGRVLKEDDLQNELDQLDAIILEEAIPSAATHAIEARQGAQRAPEEQVVASGGASKRQMVAA